MLPDHEHALRQKTAILPFDFVQSQSGVTDDNLAILIEAAAVVADEARVSLQKWVLAGRRSGMSWSDVGTTLGISKQAAQQKFGLPEDNTPDHSDDLRLVKVKATAFDEIAVLHYEGERGFELISVGLQALLFRPSPLRWAYRRTIGLTHKDKALESEGWVHVATWFLFHYFKRPVE